MEASVPGGNTAVRPACRTQMSTIGGDHCNIQGCRVVVHRSDSPGSVFGATAMSSNKCLCREKHVRSSIWRYAGTLLRPCDICLSPWSSARQGSLEMKVLNVIGANGGYEGKPACSISASGDIS